MAFGQDKSVETATISQIKVEGNKNVSSLVIYGHLQEKEGDSLSIARIREDIHGLYSMGSFKHVKIEAEKAAAPGKVVLTVVVVERPILAAITFKGNKKWDSKKFLEEMKLAPKAAFDPSKVDPDLRAIRRLYQEEGYSNVYVSSKAQSNPKSNTVALSIEIAEGNQIRVAGVTVIGSEAFSGKRIAEEMKDNKTGDKYKPDTLEDDFKKIEAFYHNEGYLKAAVVSHKEKMEGGKKVLLEITVREGQKYALGNVSFHGNLLYDDGELSKMLKLKKGRP